MMFRSLQPDRIIPSTRITLRATRARLPPRVGSKSSGWWPRNGRELWRSRHSPQRTVAIKTVSAGFADRSRPAGALRARSARSGRPQSPAHLRTARRRRNAEWDADAPLQFLVMEYLEGHTLAERLLRGPLPASDVLRYSVELADALDHAHRRGLVHRDLKPGNVMLTESGAKLLDFGLSKVQSSTDALAYSQCRPAKTADRRRCRARDLPVYVAGAATGRDVDARGDIFAMGAIVYQMATGQRAFGGTTAATVIGAVLHTDPPPVSSLQSMTPASLQ